MSIDDWAEMYPDGLTDAELIALEEQAIDDLCERADLYRKERNY
jgi:hypothetical protein